MSTSEPAPHPPGRAVRAAALALLAIVGAAMGVLPHLERYAATGEARYTPDGDDLLYLAWSRGLVLRGEPRLVDAVSPESGPMMHPALLFVPPGLAAHALGLDMTGLGILWRATAGAAIPLAAFFAVRAVVSRFWYALGLAALLALDPGMLFGELIRRNLAIAAHLAGLVADNRLEGWALPQLRVVTPGFAIPFLLVYYGLSLRARSSGRRAWAWGAGLGLGLLFHAYFYFWTVAVAGTILAWLVDRKGRRAYATILVVGLLVGLPALWHGYRTKSTTPPDWLLRTDHFVPIERFSRLLIPKASIVLAVATGAWVFLRRRELAGLWCCLAAALGLLDHQIVTGLEIENFHFLQPIGVSLSLLLVALIAPPLLEPDGRPPPRWAPPILAALVVVTVGTDIAHRLREARMPETLMLRALGASLRRDLPSVPEGAGVAGDEMAGFYLAAYREVYPLYGRLLIYAASMTDRELDERRALNLRLLGAGREDARELFARPPDLPHNRSHPPDKRGYLADPGRRDAAIARSLEVIDPVYDAPRHWIRRFGVTHVILPASNDGSHLDGLARRVESGPDWSLWEIEPAD